MNTKGRGIRRSFPLINNYQTDHLEIGNQGPTFNSWGDSRCNTEIIEVYRKLGF